MGIQIDDAILQSLSKEELLNAAALCPFHAIDYNDGVLSVNAGCKMCMLCVKKGIKGLFIKEETQKPLSDACDLARWVGIAVYIEISGGKINPVSLELIG
jgi:electron transfer flavoprotein alpha subunit